MSDKIGHGFLANAIGLGLMVLGWYISILNVGLTHISLTRFLQNGLYRA